MLISVVIPTYNRREQLFLAIESVRAQTHTNLEILICDDGSDDGSQEMVELFHDSRVKWIPGKREGHPSGPRNRGVAHACGEWIAFLDSDDIWYPTKLEEQLAKAKELGVNFVCCNANLLDDFNTDSVYLKNRKSKKITQTELLKDNIVITSSVLVKKSLIIKVKGFPECKNIIVGEDYIVWLLIALYGEMYYLDKPLCSYRDEPNQSIRGMDKRSELEKYSIVMKYCISFLFKNKFSLFTLFTFYLCWYRRWKSLKDS